MSVLQRQNVKILKRIKHDKAVTKWLRVRTKEGTEGWLITDKFKPFYSNDCYEQ